MAVPVKAGKRERISFAKIPEVLDLPNLIEIQRKSYEWFLSEGILETFFDISPIQDFTGNLLLEFVDYHLGQPKYSVKECRERDATFAAPMRVRARLITKDNGEVKEVKEQEVFMGDFPLMTDKGTFIINGAERVVVSQLVRSPGVYFNKEIEKSGKVLYGASIIPNRGAWLEFETDKNDVVYVRIDRTRKLPVTALIRALGYGSDSEILSAFGDNIYIKTTIDRDNTSTEEEGLIEVYKRLRPGEPPTVESARALFETLFFDSKRYDFASVGRYKLNKKLNIGERLFGAVLAEPITVTDCKVDEETGEVLEESERVVCEAGVKVTKKLREQMAGLNINSAVIQVDEDRVLRVFSNNMPAVDVRVITREDILATINYLVNLPYGIGDIDDIDHLGNRRLRSVGELLQNQFRIGLARMERVVRERMTIQDADVITPQALINIRPVVAAIKEFFGSSQLSQFMDQTNPLSELTHKRRLSALGPGGLSRERAGFEVRDVHHSHYGRICPIETPEGPNIGLIGSLCTYARINEFGFIETPYRRVNDSKVEDEIVYLTADEEDKYVIAQANEPIDKSRRFVNSRVASRYKDEILAVAPEEVDFMDVSPKQVFSVATALIPFLENDDANRALMGANMQRQAVPLIRAEAPRVGTGMEYKAAIDSGVVVTARNGGVVTHVSASKVVVTRDDGNEDPYELLKFLRSNQGTCINHIPFKIFRYLCQEPNTIGSNFTYHSDHH
jgi:DNA-directed RNA polymerase subunit beta